MEALGFAALAGDTTINATMVAVRKSVFFIGGLVLVVAGLLSIQDYRTWKYEETKNFGHGPGGKIENRESRIEFTEIYRNELVGLRFRTPKDWPVVEEVPLKAMMVKKIPNPRLELLLPKTGKLQLLSLGPAVRLFAQLSEMNVTDLVDRDAGAVRDRAYVNSERLAFTLWNFGPSTYAYTMQGKTVYIFIFDGISLPVLREFLQTVAVTL